MIVGKLQFDNLALRYATIEGAILFDSYDVAEVLKLSNPRQEVIHISINRNFRTELIIDHENNDTVLVCDLHFIIELALRAESDLSRRFIVWLIKQSSILLSRAVKASDQPEGINHNHYDEHDPTPPFKPVYATTQIAKKYGMSAIELNKILNLLKIHYRVNYQWVLYEKYQALGYVTFKPVYNTAGDFKGRHTYWTEKGAQFVESILIKNGYAEQLEVNFNE